MSPETYAKVMGGVWGFVLGAGVAMLIGFMWGGWTTSSTTQKMNDEAVAKMAAGRALDVRGLPSSYLIGADGKLLGKVEGAADWSSDKLRATLAKYLPTTKPPS